MQAVSARRAFTLIELLVVTAIIMVLMGLILAAVQQARTASDKSICRNNLRQIGLALHAYHDSYRVLPPGLRRSPDAYPFLSWNARLVPYLEQTAIWQQAVEDYARNPLFADPPVHAGLGMVLNVFICPVDGPSQGVARPTRNKVGFTHYLGVIGNTKAEHDGLLYLDSRVSFAQISDGASNTVMVGERPPSPNSWFGWWYAGVGQDHDGSADMVLSTSESRTTFREPTCPFGPYSFGPGKLSNPCDTFHFWSQHPGGAHFLFADGSVRFLAYSASSILPALATRAGGETVELP